MNKFNLTMTLLVVAAIVFFGFGIIQKATYKIADGDSVSISYSITSGEETYDDQSAYVTIGSNQDQLFTDKVLTGVKNGSDLQFDATLADKMTLTDTEATVLAAGTKVSIDGKITDVTPAPEVASETTSETVSE